MTDLSLKLHLRPRLLGLMLLAAGATMGGDVAVERADNSMGIRDYTTENIDLISD